MCWTQCCFRSLILFVIQLQCESKTHMTHMVLYYYSHYYELQKSVYLKYTLPLLMSYFVKL